MYEVSTLAALLFSFSRNVLCGLLLLTSSLTASSSCFFKSLDNPFLNRKKVEYIRWKLQSFWVSDYGISILSGAPYNSTERKKLTGIPVSSIVCRSTLHTRSWLVGACVPDA